MFRCARERRPGLLETAGTGGGGGSFASSLAVSCWSCWISAVIACLLASTASLISTAVDAINNFTALKRLLDVFQPSRGRQTVRWIHIWPDRFVRICGKDPSATQLAD